MIEYDYMLICKVRWLHSFRYSFSQADVKIGRNWFFLDPCFCIHDSFFFLFLFVSQHFVNCGVVRLHHEFYLLHMNWFVVAATSHVFPFFLPITNAHNHQQINYAFWFIHMEFISLASHSHSDLLRVRIDGTRIIATTEESDVSCPNERKRVCERLNGSSVNTRCAEIIISLVICDEM